MSSVQVNGHDLTSHSQSRGGVHFSADAAHSDFILIQCDDWLSEQQIEELEKLEAFVLKLVADKTYTCRYEQDNLANIRGVGFIKHANVYHETLSLAPQLHMQVSNAVADARTKAGVADTETEVAAVQIPAPADGDDDEDSQPSRYWVYVHDATKLQATIGAIVQTANVTQADIVKESEDVIRMPLKLPNVKAISQIDNVARVEQLIDEVPYNHEARNVLGYLEMGDSVRKYGRQILNRRRPLKVADLEGEGQTIAIFDTGFDLGLSTGPNVHKAFTGRVQKQYGYSTDQDYKDISGHGTHVAGSVIGSWSSKDFVGVSVQGTAPSAKIMNVACGNSRGQMDILSGSGYGSSNMEVRLSNPYDLEPGEPSKSPPCRISNHSYGPRGTGQQPYDTTARTMDRIVNLYQDYIYCVSAGNEGESRTPTGAHVTSKAAAKNTITVGACESSQFTRKNWNIWGGNYVYPSFMGSRGNPSRPTSFSSGGPTLNNRIKPDVVAPGAVIYSARSQWRGVDGSGGLICARVQLSTLNPLNWVRSGTVYDYNQTGNVVDDKYWFMNGSSMATPLVSGCCAVIRAVYGKIFSRFPSAAMVKALLVNGAIGLTPGAVWDNKSGFGRVDMDKTLTMIADNTSGGVYDSIGGFATDYSDGVNPKIFIGNPPEWYRVPGGNALQAAAPNNVWIHDVPIAQAGSTLQVTLAYSDEAGDVLRNRLDLEVEDLSIPTTRNADDDGAGNHRGLNNVQKLVWNNTAVATYRIRVRCARIDATIVPAGRRRQHFAVCYLITPP